MRDRPQDLLFRVVMLGFLIVALSLLSGCTRQVGDPQWAEVTRVDDRGGWGCATYVLTEQGATLGRRGCVAEVGQEVCIQATRRPDIGPARWEWEPAFTCPAKEQTNG